MKFSSVLGIAVVASLATTQANAAFFGKDNFRAPIKGSTRGTVGWIINGNGGAFNNAGGVNASAASVGSMTDMGALTGGGSFSAKKRHTGSDSFSDGYSFTLARDAAVSISLEDKESGSSAKTPLYNLDQLSLSLMDSSGKVVSQVGEGETATTSTLLAGDYSMSISGYAQAVKGGLYSFKVGVKENTSVIPIPAAAWLFGSALVMLTGVARRRKAV